MERTFVIRAGQLCRLLILVGLHGIGPSDLGECALVRCCCSEGTFIGLVGMDCYVLGPENFVSGNIFVLKVTIFSLQSVFANFQT